MGSMQTKGLTGTAVVGSCFTNMYDKFVQSAGGRAVGIPFDAISNPLSSTPFLSRSTAYSSQAVVWT